MKADPWAPPLGSGGYFLGRWPLEYFFNHGELFHMNPAKVDRSRLEQLTDLPNIGPSMAGDLMLLGIHQPNDLLGKDAMQLYEQLCEVTGQRHDPCVIDTFMSIVSFIEGEPPRPWWEFTAQRKALLKS